MTEPIHWSVLYLTLIAPLIISVAFRTDFIFMWVQFVVNVLFEMLTSSMIDRDYFCTAIIINAVFILASLHITSFGYALVFLASTIYIALRMFDIVSFSGGYFALIYSAMLCSVVIVRYKHGK